MYVGVIEYLENHTTIRDLLFSPNSPCSIPIHGKNLRDGGITGDGDGDMTGDGDGETQRMSCADYYRPEFSMGAAIKQMQDLTLGPGKHRERKGYPRKHREKKGYPANCEKEGPPPSEHGGNAGQHSLFRAADVLLGRFKRLCEETAGLSRCALINLFPTFGEFCEAVEIFGHSVAWHSAIGYVLGIGDRHLGNIMLNLHTGKIAHIDFGYTLEVSRLLKIPERVPFRLSQFFAELLRPCVFEIQLAKSLKTLREFQPPLVAAITAIVYDLRRDKNPIHPKKALLRVSL